jgi:cob(I)alamin adenosyltransferase
MKIYTKFGDAGQTALFDGRKVSKDHLRIETYGTVDELNSVLGLAIVDCRHEKLRNILTTLQDELFDLGADLATPLDSANAAKIGRIGEMHIAFLEKTIDEATAELPALRAFILPGGGITAARLHVGRTVCRRAERLLVTLIQHENFGEPPHQPLIYLNRLSDLLFTLARWSNKLDGIVDVEWRPHAAR